MATVPPVPVPVSQQDLPRVLAILVGGYGSVYWLALQMDEHFAADDQDEHFGYPYVVYAPACSTYRALPRLVKRDLIS